MPISVSRWLRVARGFGATGVSTIVAATAHGVAGGGFPAAIALGFAILFGGLAGMLLAGRPLGRVRLAVTVVTAQLIFHGLFTLFGSATGTARIVETHGSHHNSYAFIGGAADAPVPADMTLMHLMAAIASYALIRHGLQVFARLIQLAAMLIDPLRRACALLARPVSALPRLVVAALSWRPTITQFLSGSIERGPPVALGH
ncbi:hypothetical protein [Diaminobutyricimonas sp. LJ205]|uniref:hypothetical protein n=1 Tax=Diaminobutyricimonas sp. LJ205 TaxID=2683590 RepID=UPI0012F48C8F|nr:hypothetical protein [Diaminobutyricimonas sp. LJ205]